jgi:hypothetical protein
MKRHLIITRLAAVASLAFLASNVFAAAQGVTANPLRTEKTQAEKSLSEKTVPNQRQAKIVATTPEASAVPDKPKRERSAKQKQSDEDMKSCGTTWREEKDALKTKGETWRSYLKTCRAQLKTSRGA